MSFQSFSLNGISNRMDTRLLLISVLIGALILFGIQPRNRPPIADFSYLAGTEGAEIRVGMRITFYNQSKDPDGDRLLYHWDFGDGSASSEENPDHVFQGAQDYSVVLTAVDSTGADDSKRKTVRVEPACPIASFEVSPPNPTTNVIVTFEDDSFHPGKNSIVKKTWVFDMAEPDICISRSGSEFREEKVYGRPGTYRVMLTVEDDQGLTDSCIREVVVSDLSGVISKLIETVDGLRSDFRDLNLAARLDSLDRAVRDVLSARRFGWGAIGTMVGILLAIGLGMAALIQGWRRKQR